jgi:release factor glutamine methyltransferase
VTEDRTFAIAPNETRAAALDRLAALLEGSGVDEARADARALLLAAAGLTHAQWVLEPSALLGQEAAARLAGYAARRACRAFWRSEASGRSISM